MAEPTLTRQQARELVDRIRKRMGGYTEEERRRISSTADGADLLQSIDSLRRALSDTTKTLAIDLYHKKTRFVYELIQNADDNDYKIARSQLEPSEPYLTFTVTSNHIVIDSNEDGFNEANARAICDIGKSTKRNKSGYIGEKGIGFKSVFKKAKKVQIQSGPFSFAFNYDKNDPQGGLGMITPFNTETAPADSLPSDVRTRITLDLLTSHDDDDDDDNPLKAFRKVPETLLLFLSKLRKLTLRIAEGETEFEDREYTLHHHTDWDEIEVRVGTETRSLRFWTADYDVVDMPSDPARKDIHQARIVLAFPVDATNMPCPRPEHVYAFLPLRKFGFQFLIQSDFITQANREDVTNSRWNHRLLNEIADLFMRNLQEFAKEPRLKYTWVRFIPVDQVADEFWQTLRQKLLTRLREAKAFETLGGALRTPSTLRKLTPEYCDADGWPLLPDLLSDDASSYVSDEYDSELDWPKLEYLGARTLTQTEFVYRLEKMLSFEGSRMVTESPDSDWHVRIANALLICSADKRLFDRISRLPLIPLSKGRWVASRGASIWFPKCGGIKVPTDLGAFNTIEQAAFDVAPRRRLFKKLGALECDPLAVFDHIEDVYTKGRRWNWEQHIDHIRFLYWHHNRLPAAGRHLKLKIAWFEDDELKASFPHTSDRWIYDETDNDHAGMLLFEDEIRNELVNDIIFFSSKYRRDLRKIECRHGLEVIPWLHQVLGVRQNIEIHRRKSDFAKALASREFATLAWHKPQWLLSMLVPHRAALLSMHKEWEPIISRLAVPVLQSDFRKPLKTTFMPRPELLASVKALNLQNDFGFIEELDDVRDSDWSDWLFLEKFGVKHRLDLPFWLHVLRRAGEQNSPVTDLNKIFAELQRFHDEVETIKSELNKSPLVPWRKTRYVLKDCVWADDDTRIPGKASIASDFPQRHTFFVDYLGVPLPSLKMHVDALVQRSASPSFTKEEALQLMQNICLFEPDETAVKALLNCPIFPVRMPTGRTHLFTSAVKFHIFDRIQHQRILGSRVNHLDLTIEDLHEIEPLLMALELRSRFSSRVVAESTAVKGSTRKGRLTIDLRSKAYAICRFADYGRSHRCANREGIRRTLEVLRSVQCHQSDGITKVYKIRDVYNEWLSIPADKADCHVEETGNLDIYISSDAKRRHICITNELPRRLLGHLGINKDDLVNKLGTILSASSLDDVDELLEQYGITNSIGVSRPDSDELANIRQSLDSADLLSPESTSIPSSRVSTPAVSSPSSDFNHLAGSGSPLPRSPIVGSHAQLRTPEPSTRSNMASRSSASNEPSIQPSTLNQPVPAEDIAEQYKQLLEFIVDAGRHPGLSTLPRAGTTSMSSIGPDHDLNKTLLASNRSERDQTKIGAAGELLVFEILKGLNIMFFSEHNWQSKIRGFVNVLEEYSDLANWPGPETSDIVFDDTNFDLYKILRDLGYFAQGELPKRAFRFQIEVKTTVLRLEEEFHMSQKQVDLMNNTAPTMYSNREKIFIIARVFNLGRADMGLKLYVDPARLRSNGELIFETSYKVRPRR